MCGLLLSAGARAAGENPYLAQARSLYEGLEFERCLERLKQATQWENTPAERIDLEMYGGLCAFSVGREAQARDHFEVVLRLCPTCTVPKYTSPRIVALFEKLSREFKARAADAPTVEAPPPPSVPVVQAASERSRSFFWPAVLGGSAAIAAGFGVGFGVVALNQERAASSRTYETEIERERAWARASARNANISYGVAGAMAVAAAVSLFFTGVDAPTTPAPSADSGSPRDQIFANLGLHAR